jgi:plasmid maintenance system antidote protein VapI
MTKRPATITDSLRETIIASGMTMKALGRETGVQRLSIARFVRGEQSIRLDVADKLAAYFGLVLQPIRKKKGR